MGIPFIIQLFLNRHIAKQDTELTFIVRPTLVLFILLKHHLHQRKKRKLTPETLFFIKIPLNFILIDLSLHY